MLHLEELVGERAAGSTSSRGFLRSGYPSGVFKDEKEFPEGEGEAVGPAGKSDIMR